MEELYRNLLESSSLSALEFWIIIFLFFLLAIKLISSFIERRKVKPTIQTIVNIPKPKSPLETVTIEKTPKAIEPIKPENETIPPREPQKINTIRIEDSPSIVKKDKQETIPLKEAAVINTKTEVLHKKTTTKPKENLPIAEVEPQIQKEETLFVNYTCSQNEQLDFYPIFRCPQKNTVVRSYRIGTTKRRGFKDEVFQKAIQEIFGEYFFI